jgi:iron complex transport system substrate-binding protein
MKYHTLLVVSVLALVAAFYPLGAQVPSRILMGGKAVGLVADAVYAFPSARPRIMAIGGMDQGMGEFLRIVDPGIAALPPFDRQAGAEAYAAFKPDLVILKSGLRSGVGGRLEALGIRTEYISLESPQEWYADLTALGRLFGTEDRSRQLVAYYQDIVGRVAAAADKALAARKGVKPRVLIVQASGDGFEVPPDTWMQSLMVGMAGGEPVWKGSSPGSGWTKVGAEQIAAWDPEVLIVISYSQDAPALARKLAADPRFSGLKAAMTGRMPGFARDFVSWDQPDTRWALGLLWLLDAIHPGALPSYSATAEARRFFALFYGVGDAAFDAGILPRLSGAGS